MKVTTVNIHVNTKATLLQGNISKYPEREAGQLKKGVGRINPRGFFCACNTVVVVAVDVMVIGAVILLVMVVEVV